MAEKAIKEKPHREKLYTIEEMALLLNVEKRMIVEWVQYRRIPFVKVNHDLIRFRLSDINHWVRERQRAEAREKFSLR